MVLYGFRNTAIIILWNIMQFFEWTILFNQPWSLKLFLIKMIHCQDTINKLMLAKGTKHRAEYAVLPGVLFGLLYCIQYTVENNIIRVWSVRTASYRQFLLQFSSVTPSSSSPQTSTAEKIRATRTAKQQSRANTAIHFCWDCIRHKERSASYIYQVLDNFVLTYLFKILIWGFWL